MRQAKRRPELQIVLVAPLMRCHYSFNHDMLPQVREASVFQGIINLGLEFLDLGIVPGHLIG